MAARARALAAPKPLDETVELRQRLAARGFVVTQATLSRDIKELGLLKRSADGAYQPAGDDVTPQATALGTLPRALAEIALESGETSVTLRPLYLRPAGAKPQAQAVERR